jgi:hypothetical protein
MGEPQNHADNGDRRRCPTAVALSEATASHGGSASRGGGLRWGRGLRRRRGPRRWAAGWQRPAAGQKEHRESKIHRWPGKLLDQEEESEIGKKIDRRKCNARNSAREKTNPKFWLWYHIMNSTCIQYEGSWPKYIYVQVISNMHKTPYTIGENTTCIYVYNTPKRF